MLARMNTNQITHSEIVKRGETKIVKKIRDMEGIEKRLVVSVVDVLDYHSILEAVKGCCALFCCLDSQEGYDDKMVNLEVRGAINVVEACAQTYSIQKIVYNSSLTAAIWRENTCSEKDVDEKSWSNQDFCRKKKWEKRAKAKPKEPKFSLAADAFTHFKHLLLPITDRNPYLSEGTRQAAATTAALAKKYGADITIVGMYYLLPSYAGEISRFENWNQMATSLCVSKHLFEKLPLNGVIRQSFPDVALRGFISEQWELLWVVFDHFPETFGITFDVFQHAYALVESRAWRNTRRVSLIPFADFLNHDGDAEADVIYVDDEGKERSEVIADRNYAPGEQSPNPSTDFRIYGAILCLGQKCYCDIKVLCLNTIEDIIIIEPGWNQHF
ncbi:hypothetical protein Vadar_025287 [Vaccinium darrowii]|uniref:Uncharacterized protein n=1 Tax=Vaccinium darrowii TaxID=229202 RepID=A0ACB7XUP5_9ERIC|nr:hypothetical protein Vadar_025287 [Vaccinium darrowii]